MSSPARCIEGEDSAPGQHGRGLMSSWRGRVLRSAVLIGIAEAMMARAPGLLAANQEPITVRFDRQVYEAVPDQPFAVNVIIAPPSSGLFSYGVRLTFPSISLAAAPSDAITVPAPLDFNGVLGVGALKQIESNLMAVKGTVRPDPLVEAYKSELLAIFNLQITGARLGDSIPLELDIFRSIGTTETVFVDGEGNDLDSRITFGSAVVTIVPEPSTLLLLALPMVVGVMFCRGAGSRREVLPQ